MHDVDLKNALERIATLERELSEYQRIETKLRENEEKFRLLVESTSDWIWEVDAHGNYTYVSPQVEILLGYSPAEVVGKSPFNFIPSEEIQHVGSEFKKCIENRLPIIALRNTNICKDGTLKILETNGVPFFDKKGEFAGYRGIDRDITERILIETMLKQERDFSNRLVETAPLIIVILSPEGKIIRVNNYMESVSGYSLKEVEGKDWFDIFLPESQREKTKKIFMTAIDDIQTIGNINTILTKDGSQKLIEWYDKTLKNAEGNTVGLLSIGLDVTDRKEDEKKLKLFRLLLDHSSDAIEIIEPLSMRFLDINETECKTLGYTREEMLSMSVFDIDPMLDADSMEEINHQLLQTGSLQTERMHRRKDGSIFPVEVNVTLVKHDKSYMLGIARDITERKIAEQSLRESEEKFHSITASAQDAILMMDDEGKITYWNKSAEKIFGYSENEIMGWPLHDLLAPKRFLAAHHVGFDHFKKTGEGAAIGKTVELAALKKDGTEFPIELSLSTLLKNGRWSAIGILRDITERKKMEKEIKEKDEMMLTQSKQAAMGDMIAMIAHQWRQPLAIMGMDINNLIMSISLDEEITTDYLVKLSEALNQQVQQLSTTIDNFRNFFKPNQSKVEITIDEVIHNTLNIIGSSCENNNITLTIHDTSKSSLLINTSSLIQVFLNLLGNAKDMLLANKVADAAITITVTETDEVIIISICDNAGGIPESIMHKIGQPYFTTKQEFNGTGLGLYISRSIIEKHLFGTLTWHNEEKGACFVITLKIKPDKEDVTPE